MYKSTFYVLGQKHQRYVDMKETQLGNMQGTADMSFHFYFPVHIRSSYLIFVIFFTHAKFLENKIYTEIYTVHSTYLSQAPPVVPVTNI